MSITRQWVAMGLRIRARNTPDPACGIAIPCSEFLQSFKPFKPGKFKMPELAQSFWIL